jgi:murein DD-endopeptidase MepM/ murein hydrolase activator NlpD
MESERNTPMTRHNKHELKARKRNRKAEPKRTTPATSHRIPTVFISSVYLFTPLLFITPTWGLTPKIIAPAVADTPIFVDLLDGMGGPDKTPTSTLPPLKTLELAFEQDESRFATIGSNVLNSNLGGIDGPKVTVTKVYNYLKVANTVMPTTSPEITSQYGWRTPPCNGCSADHKGVDFVPGVGKPIFAVADGMVIEMGSNGGYGNYVKLKHLMGNSEGVMEEWVTLYAHMQDNSFPEGMIIGSVVKSGDTIGAVGSTGMSTGPHLHFELIINGEHVDPLPLLGTYEVIIVTEEDHPDHLFVGEKFRSVERIVTYE